ncbi:MAG: preprotein translocase subunit SecE [Anaerolineales bacterium]|nr:preprotein translocase subunit SecE [Anaerolineales bacterium]
MAKYLKETRAELRKVSWPTRQEVLNLTLIVVGFTIFMAALLGIIDYIFAWAFGLIIR